MAGDSSCDYDCVVVGQGLMGSSALHSLSARGQRVLGLEQFDVGHGRGSSHGHTRIVRTVYPQQHFSDMAADAFKQWHALEAECNTKVITTTGEIDFGADLTAVKRCVREKDIPHSLLSPAEAHRKWPGFAAPADYEVLHTFDSGIINAAKALSAMRSQACKRGASILDNRRVCSVKDTRGVIEVECDGGHVYRTRKLILAPGAWLGPMAKQLFGIDLDIRVIQVGYWYFADGGTNHYDYRHFPVWIKYDAEHFYGTPSYEYPGMLKIGAHFSPNATTADSRNFSPVKLLEEKVIAQIQEHFVSCEPQPALAETCLYSVTRNEDFVLGSVPGHPDIVLAGGGSGHAFKHGPAIGEALADLALHGESARPYVVDGFKVERHLASAAARL